MAGHHGVSSIVVGSVLLLAVLDPTHSSPVKGIDVELAIATRDDEVDDEGGSRGDHHQYNKEKFVQHTQ
jgi:hypothetical protein